MSNYNQLKEVLNDIFELNKADLDFGIYRIINQKRRQVNEFIDKQLPADIKAALSQTQSVDKVELEKELHEMKKNLEGLGYVAEDNPKYKTKLEQLKGLEDTEGLEAEVFSHLANFFRRYYKDGDFISMRRYKKDVYAIPYEGEEVKLHWANHDQYYIKSSENFKNYSFVLPDGKKVSFQLKEVSTEQNNNKTQGDAERRFALYEEQPVEEQGNELYINFIYEPFPKATKQDALMAKAIEVLVDNIPAAFSGTLALSPTEKNKTRILLEKHLEDYVARNSFDYFIHKDLGGFLGRELDFYIKNEVLYIDDINARQTDFFVAQLSKVKAIKVVAQKIVDFLAQIENFQKKLWLKKKFVIRTDYCITLDRVPSSYYAEIAQNKAQLEEWKKLFDVTILNENQLPLEPYLVLDTKFFDEPFKDRLLAEFEDLDEQTNGLMINSENFQALNLIENKYLESIQGIYIDPPYNTSASEIIYKNSFRDSSWLSLINDRLSSSLSLLKEVGNLCVTIDDFEKDKLKLLLDGLLGKESELGVACIRNNPSGRSTVQGFSIAHEYGLFYGRSQNSRVGRLERNEKQINRYDEIDEIGAFEWVNFRKHGGTKEESPSMFYPFFVSIDSYRLPELEWREDNREWLVKETPKPNERIVYPVDERGIDRRWKWGIDRVRNCPNDLCVKQDRTGQYTVYCKARMNDSGVLPLTWWEGKEYSATAYGTNLIKELFNSVSKFSYPKSINAVMDSLKVLNINSGETAIDFFGGSGTTGHATIKLNREDDGNRGGFVHRRTVPAG